MLVQCQLFLRNLFRLTDMQQIFNVSLRPLDGGILQMQYLESDAVRIIDDLTDHFFMDLRFSDHAVFTDFAPARFELWLDQTYHLTPSL